MIVLILDLILPRGQGRPWWYAVSLAGIVLSGWYSLSLWSDAAGGVATFGGAFVLDRLGLMFGLIVLAAAFLATLLSVLRHEEDVSGYLSLVLWAAMGMMLLAGAGNLLTLFLGLELFSLSLYVLVAFGERDARSKEAGFKYLILGSAASAVMLFGFAFLYGQTGTVALTGLLAGWSGEGLTLMKVGVGLVILGFAFKLALVPFHKWAPDVYEGASAPITAFMTVGTRAAALAGLIRFVMAIMPDQGASLLTPIWVIAAASMVLGSLSACVQSNIKRILAYSGIAHAGYLMLALLGLSQTGFSAAAFYMMAYLFMNVGALAVVMWMSRGDQEGETLSDIRGLFHQRPWLAAAMTLFMLSLIGFPTTAGFSGKLILVSTALSSGVGSVAGWLVAALALTSAISAYAYLRVVMAMFGGRQVAEEAVGHDVVEAVAPADDTVAVGVGRSWALASVVVLCVVGTLYLGLMPGQALEWAANLLPMS